MGSVVVDTHAAIWYLLKSPKLSSNALAALDKATQAGDTVHLASISLIELTYLVEKARLPESALQRLNDAITGGNASFNLVPLDLGVVQAVRRVPRDVVPDMPDRIIAATALHLNLPLVTRDPEIRAAGVQTIW